MNRSKILKNTTAAALAMAFLTFQWGCAGPAASKTVKGAGTGAAIGAVGGLVTGQDAGGIAAAGAAGALVGATVGAIQQNKENKRQDTLAQQRAYNQAIAMQKRAIDKEKAELQEELEIAEGFRISNAELSGRAESAEERLKALQAIRQAAIDRKKALDEMEQREKDALAEIARLEKELAALEAESGSIASDVE